MKNILKTPQWILDDCPARPKLANTFYRLMLWCIPLAIAAWTLILLDKAPSLLYTVLVTLLTISFCLAIIAMSAITSKKHNDSR